MLQAPESEEAEALEVNTTGKRLRNGRPAASRQRVASLTGRRGGLAEYSDDDGDLHGEVRPCQSCLPSPWSALAHMVCLHGSPEMCLACKTYMDGLHCLQPRELQIATMGRRAGSNQIPRSARKTRILEGNDDEQVSLRQR